MKLEVLKTCEASEKGQSIASSSFGGSDKGKKIKFFRGANISVPPGLDVCTLKEIPPPTSPPSLEYVNLESIKRHARKFKKNALFQDSFTVFDPKQLRRKGKERHIFLFEQALLFSKETKDPEGKIKYLYKNKIKVGEKTRQR